MAKWIEKRCDHKENDEAIQEPTLSGYEAKRIQDEESDFKFYRAMMARSYPTLIKGKRGRWVQKRIKGVLK